MELQQEFEQIRDDYYGAYRSSAPIYIKVKFTTIYIYRVMMLILTNANWKQKAYIFTRSIGWVIEHLFNIIAMIGVFLLIVYIFVTIYLWFIPIINFVLSLFSIQPWAFNDWLIHAVPIGMQPSGDFLTGIVRFIAFLASVLGACTAIGALLDFIQFLSPKDTLNCTTKARVLAYILRIVSLLAIGVISWGMLYFFCYFLTPDTWAHYTLHILGAGVVLFLLFCMISNDDTPKPSMGGILHNEDNSSLSVESDPEPIQEWDE